MRLASIIFLICCLALPAYSQTTLTGVIKNRQGEPLVVNVTVQAKGNRTISGFTTTNAEGRYSLTYNGTADSLSIVVSGIAIGKHSRMVSNRSATIHFDIEEKALELKEVVVTTTPIRRTGDTLNYVVDAYTGQNDRVIEDVLKKMPGIEVNSIGKISYNGKNINKFYIENLDLLQGRYGIATKNISAKDVASVQVYENHQPIKALKDKILSDQAAINLKLKDKAKGTLAITALAGAGAGDKQELWIAELVAMYFAGKQQNITTYKGNNVGKDASSELQSHYDYEQANSNNNSILSVSEPRTPPTDQKRYLYNTFNSVTTNQLFKINDKELIANLSYYNDRVNKEGYSLSEQFLPGDTSLRIEEQVKNISKSDHLDLSFHLNSNTIDNYMKNTLNFKGSWNNSQTTGIIRSNAGNTDEILSQFLDKPQFSVENTLNMLKNIGKKAYKFYFSAAYNTQPHSLSVAPANYFEHGRLASLEQNALLRNFVSTLRGSFGIKLGNFSLDYAPWLSVDIRGLETELNGKDTLGRFIPAVDSLKNNLWYSTYQVGVTQNYFYKNGEKFKANLALPVVNYSLTTDDRISEQFTRYNRWIINPSLSASYDLTTELTASVGVDFRKSYGNMNDVYSGYIMHSYRSLLRNTIDRLFETASGGSNVSLGYRGVLPALFLNIQMNYRNSRKNLLYGYNYLGIMSAKTTIDRPTESENYSLQFNGSKGIRFWNTTLRAFGGYNETRGEQLIQDEILHFRSENYSAGISANTSPFRFMSVDYNFGWLQSRNYSEELSERFPPIRSHSHEVKIWFFPTQSVSINLNGDYSYNSAANNHNTTFADALIRYKYKQTEWELECNNLLNAKQYVSASYSDISTYYYSYNLRPISFLLNIRFKLK